MNRYGQMAQAHWTRWLPERLAEMTEPDQVTFFTAMGSEVERQIQEMATAIAGPDRPGETYLQKLGRLREAQMTAESDILREQVLLAPESEADGDPKWPGDAPWQPLVREADDPDPVWQEELARIREIEQERREQLEQMTNQAPPPA